MIGSTKLWLRAVVLCVAVLGGVEGVARAQVRGGLEAPGQTGVAPAELQRMFDAYALVQAQEQLKIGDEQYPQFLARFKTLQDVRRRAQQQRTRIVIDLRRLGLEAQPDEAAIKEQLRQLHDLETRTLGETQKAYDVIDQVLDVRQQAQFRVFEEQMERRKLEILMRARQANRQRNRGNP